MTIKVIKPYSWWGSLKMERKIKRDLLMHIHLPKCHTLYTHHHKTGIVKVPNYTIIAEQMQIWIRIQQIHLLP